MVVFVLSPGLAQKKKSNIIKRQHVLPVFVEWVMVDRIDSCKSNCFLSLFLGGGGSGYVGGYILPGTLTCRVHNFLQLLDGTLNM
jgi:hypothetical protein